MTESRHLLQRYADTGSEAAFSELVERYINLVYSTALRLVNGDSHRAQDVTQAVFIDLARQASSLSSAVMIGGWLHRHACFTAINLMRGERRRQVREREAMEMNAMDHDAAADFSHIAPILDEALDELGDDDRTAILLRFFEQQDFRSVGKELGTTEDTARMRVNRALEKLERLLKRRGVTTTAAALGVTISAHAIQTAPANLASTIAGASLLGTSVHTSVAVALTKSIVMNTLQKTLLAGAFAVAVGVSLYEAREASSLREQIVAHQQQLASKDETVQRWEHEHDEFTKQLTALRLENERLHRDTAELAKLRGETSRLRNDLADRAQRNVAAEETPTDATARRLAGHVAELKSRFEQWPRKTPELELLTDKDWWNEVANHELDDEKAYRESMGRLRYEAKRKFAGKIDLALQQFATVNNEQLPSDLSQLQSYLDAPMYSWLENYEIAPPGSVKPPQPNSPDSKRAETWALVEKGSMTKQGVAVRKGVGLADPDYDMHIVIYNGGYYGYGPDRGTR